MTLHSHTRGRPGSHNTAQGMTQRWGAEGRGYQNFARGRIRAKPASVRQDGAARGKVGMPASGMVMGKGVKI